MSHMSHIKNHQQMQNHIPISLLASTNRSLLQTVCRNPQDHSNICPELPRTARIYKHLKLIKREPQNCNP